MKKSIAIVLFAIVVWAGYMVSADVYLRDRKIYVRYWDKPLINNYLRITVGTSTDMQKLFDALAEIVK